MNKKYTIRFYDNQSILLTKPVSTILVYRIPYNKIREGGIEIANRFIVYILFGKNGDGKDTIYVGKSKNGLDNRPTSHNNKSVEWKQCFILTDVKFEGTILNDGTIQYLEDKISNRVISCGRYENVTEKTTAGTANSSDAEDCDIYLEDAYDMLFALGLDLGLDNIVDDDTDDVDEIGQINMEIPQKFETLYDGILGLLKDICPDAVIHKTKVYHKYVINNKTIATIACTQSALKLYFNIPFNKMIDGNHILFDVSAIGHNGTGDCYLPVIDDRYFDDIRDFFEQVITYRNTDLVI